MVNTFILTDDPKECAKRLDPKRLGKQRVEAFQIIKVLINKSTGHSNHPCTKMWQEHLDGLKYYTNCMIDEWISRGYKNTMLKYDNVDASSLPWWYSNKQIHYANMASLVRKDPNYYTSFTYPSVYDKFGYIWMNHLTDLQKTNMKQGQVLDVTDICDPIGKGAPSHFRLTRDQANKWALDKNTNPLTGRKIISSGQIYKDFVDAFTYYSKN